jgi:hypothetical protein
MNRCPRCDSPSPELHPSVQCEGEVSICTDDYHRTVTAMNTPERIAKVQAMLQRDAAPTAP